jgi:hypothetical protein
VALVVLRRWGLVFLLLPEDMYRGLRTAFYDSGGGFGGGGVLGGVGGGGDVASLP